jgi:hypothetical protein
MFYCSSLRKTRVRGSLICRISAGGAMDDGKAERFVQGVGIVAIMGVIMWLLMLADDSRPSVRQVCHAHPHWNEVVVNEGEDDERVYWCHHDGDLAGLIVAVLSPLEFWVAALIAPVLSPLDSLANRLNPPSNP